MLKNEERVNITRKLKTQWLGYQSSYTIHCCLCATHITWHYFKRRWTVKYSIYFKSWYAIVDGKTIYFSSLNCNKTIFFYILRAVFNNRTSQSQFRPYYTVEISSGLLYTNSPTVRRTCTSHINAGIVKSLTQLT